jgi:hypothetical protein
MTGAVRSARVSTALLIGAAALVVLVGLVRAQQTAVALVDGDDISITCPTALTIMFESDSTASITCAAESAPQPEEESAATAEAPTQVGVGGDEVQTGEAPAAP